MSELRLNTEFDEDVISSYQSRDSYIPNNSQPNKIIQANSASL